MPIILAVRRERQEDQKFMFSLIYSEYRASLGYMGDPISKQKIFFPLEPVCIWYTCVYGGNIFPVVFLEALR